jgi:6-phosphogluconolactonase (cycloisomerase 2 family)
LDVSKRFLYSGKESGSGSASAFSINPQTGELRFLKSVGTGGQPAHVIVQPGGKHLLTANYTGGTVAVVPIQADGSLGTTPQIIAHFGNWETLTSGGKAPAHGTAGFNRKVCPVNDLGLMRPSSIRSMPEPEIQPR